MEQLKLISIDECKRISKEILEYGRSNRRLTYCGVGAVVIIVACKLSLRKRFFAWLFSASTDVRIEKYEEMKKAFFSQMSEQVSHDKALREQNSIKILEVGVGSGTNFAFYPEGCHLIAVDPNPFFGQYYDKNRSKFPNVKSAEIIIAKGEDMDLVKSDSVDAVVVTLVMCSVSDMDQFLHQVKRVLAPGGKFYFVEHVKEWDSKNHWRRMRLQQILSFTRFWPFVFDGCRLDRDPLPLMREVGGFSDIQSDYFYAPIPGGIGTLVATHLKGVATK